MTFILLFNHSARAFAKISALALVILLSACQSSPPNSTTAYRYVPQVTTATEMAEISKTPTLQRLYQQYERWHGTPYRLGGNSLSGIDCSGFVQVTFRDQFDIDLPRTTRQQISMGERVKKSELQPGDLIFFRKGGHVGIYLEDNKFLHASTRLGITISDLDNVYWSRYYWRAISVRPP